MKQRILVGAFAAVSLVGACSLGNEVTIAPEGPVGGGGGGDAMGGMGGAGAAGGGGGAVGGMGGGAGGGSGVGGGGGAPPLNNGFLAWKDEVIYSILVDRFLDGDPSNNGSPTPGVPSAADYQGGDWQGVINKIQEGYFTNLGVTALLLTIPMNNADVSEVGTDGKQYSAYHGNWPKEIDQAEEHFGDMAKLKELVDDAHAVGLKVLYEYEANHVHETSSLYALHQNDGWFWPNDDGMGGTCFCGAGCNWGPPEAETCWRAPYLPDFNHENAFARSFTLNNAIAWFQQTGMDGYRLDALKNTSMSWLTDLRTRVQSDIEPSLGGNHFFMFGTTHTGDKLAIKKYVDPNTLLDGQLDFPLRADICTSILMRQGTMHDLESSMNSNDGFYGNGIMSTFLGYGNFPRIIHLAEDTPLWSSPWDGGKDKNWSNQPALPGGISAFERVANGFTVLMTTPGIPLIYYGDEIGLPGAGEPDNGRLMQWTNHSAGQLLLRGHIEKLGQIRKNHIALRRGNRVPLSATSDTMVYAMEHATETVYVAINRGNQSAPVSNLPSGSLTNLLNGQTVTGPAFNVPHRSSMVLVAQ